MASIRMHVIGAWVDELLDLGQVTHEEANIVLENLFWENNISPLVSLAQRLGDVTPLEILAAGFGGHGNSYVNGGRPCLDQERLVSACCKQF